MSAVPFPPCIDGAAVKAYWQRAMNAYLALAVVRVRSPLRDVLGVEPGASGWVQYGQWWMPHPPEPVDLATVEGYAGA